MNNLKYYHQALIKKLSKKRYEHSVSVAETAWKLAKKHGYSTEDAYLSGLLHDYAREMPPQELEKLAKDKGFTGNEIMEAAPILWHGPVGAILIEKELGLENPMVLEGIHYHTTGGPGIGEIAKIVFLADLIEPGRQYSEVDLIKREAFSQLNRGVFIAYELLMGYHIEKGNLIHPLTLGGRNELLISRRS